MTTIFDPNLSRAAECGPAAIEGLDALVREHGHRPQAAMIFSRPRAVPDDGCFWRFWAELGYSSEEGAFDEPDFSTSCCCNDSAARRPHGEKESVEYQLMKPLSSRREIRQKAQQLAESLIKKRWRELALTRQPGAQRITDQNAAAQAGPARREGARQCGVIIMGGAGQSHPQTPLPLQRSEHDRGF